MPRWRPRPGVSWRRGLAALALLAAALAAGRASADEPPVVAAAANLRFALERIAEVFERETGRHLRLSFGSSGNLRRQIAQGAPYELFLSADEGYVLALAEAGRTRDRGRVYAYGRLALVARRDSPLRPDPALAGLRAALEAGAIRRFAIANPEHAPYGVAAREVLQALGLWARLQPRLVLGESVSQAARFALSPDTQGGLVAYSLLKAPALAARAAFAVVPESLHAPLTQRMVLLPEAGETAEAFYAFMQSAPARRILRDYGFSVPGETG